ncbi:MAG: OmpA family protein [Lautropia sp.]
MKTQRRFQPAFQPAFRPAPLAAALPAVTRPALAALAGLLVAIAALQPLAAGAQGVVVYRAGERVDPSAVARILSGAGDEVVRPAGVRTRSLRLLDGSGPAAAAPAPALPPNALVMAERGSRERPAAERVPTSLSLPVQFAFDSAELLPDALVQLDAVAEGIKMTAPDRAVLIEGHTDSTGPDAYNQSLSERRADAVKRYLIGTHGIAPQRLNVVGLGESSPVDSANPSAAVNRRVQFRGG